MIFLYAFFFRLFARIAFDNPPEMLLPEQRDEPVAATADTPPDEMQRHH